MKYIQKPQEIEQNSFRIIAEIIAQTRPDYLFKNEDQEAIIKRAIHTSADFDWLDILYFSDDVIDNIRAGILNGCVIYTDTTMALSGINKVRLAKYGCECRCYISDPRVVEMAIEQQITRSMAAVDIAMQEPGDKIFVFGNAPTALFRLMEHQEKPLAVVGVPVGFVGAAESKDELVASDLSCIAALGRKGGSNIAAAIINAIIYRTAEGE